MGGGGIALQREIGHNFVINYGFYCTLNPNPEFIAGGILNYFVGKRDNKYKRYQMRV